MIGGIPCVARVLLQQDERKEVVPLIKKIVRWLKPLISKGKIPILEADRGYDAMSLRVAILTLKIFPFIPYRKTFKGKQKTGAVYLEKKRWQKPIFEVVWVYKETASVLSAPIAN